MGIAISPFIMTNPLLDQQRDSAIEGVCADKRIGNLYSEKPYLIDGKCLPKGLSQLCRQTNSRVLQGVYQVNQMQEIKE